MQTGPKIKLAIDLVKIGKYFPLDYNLNGGFDYDMIIDRQKYDEVAAILYEYDISDDQVILEICFLLLWIEKETRVGNDRDSHTGKYHQMLVELDKLKQYLMKHRIISISLKGEYERNKAGEELILKEDINIDRLCDGIRSIFSDEFNSDIQKRGKKGLTAWKRRKMIRIKNNFLNYFTTVPLLDELSLEDQHDLIGKLSELAGLPGEK